MAQRIPTAKSLEQRAEAQLELMRMDKSKMEKMLNALLAELSSAISIHGENPSGDFVHSRCSLMSLDCCIDTIPTGREKGSFYGIDFGGTNIRIVRILLKGDGTSDISQIKDNIRNEAVSEELPLGLLDPKATASQLFDAIALRMKKLMKKEGDLGKTEIFPVGFTFSFGLKQLAIDSAILMCWTKEFKTGTLTNDKVEGRDVCLLLNQSFERHQINARVVAALNDTTGTMLAAAYEKPKKNPPCLIGLIIGTGMNGCYVDGEAPEHKYQGTVINCEAGNFNKCLPINSIDLELDHNSANPGRQLTEKMLSALYIPEMVRLLVLKTFQRQAADLVWVENSIGAEGCAAIYNDDSSDYSATKSTIKAAWDWDVKDEKSLRIIYKLCSCVFERSASLAAVIIAGLAKKTRRLQPAMGGVTVGVDGSLYCLNSKYQKHVRRQLEKLLSPGLADLIKIVETSDGSGKGAAILAGAITSQK